MPRAGHSEARRSPRVLALAAAAAVLYLWGLVVHARGMRGPELDFPFGWRWAYRPTPHPFCAAPALAAAAALAVGLAAWSRCRPRAARPRRVLFVLVAGSVAFRAALTACDPGRLNAGAYRILWPRPIDFFVDAQSLRSFRELWRAAGDAAAHRRLHGHSLTKPPGPVALARALLEANRRCPALRRGVLAAASRLPGYEVVARLAPDPTLLAAAELWALLMTGAAVLTALPLFAFTRRLAGARAALWAAAFWLFSPSVVLFSPEISQPVAFFGMLGLWLAHEACERGGLWRGAAAGLALLAGAALNFSGLAAAGVVGVYLAARLALGLRRGRAAALAALVVLGLACSAALAGWFETLHFIRRYERDGVWTTSGLPPWAALSRAVLLGRVQRPSDLLQGVVLAAGAAFHLALFAGLATVIVRAPAGRLPWPGARRLAALAALPIGLLAGAGAVGLALGANPARFFQTAFAGSHSVGVMYLNYWLWQRWNPVCFFLFAGLTASLLWAWAACAARELPLRMCAAVFAACFALLCVNAAGVTRAEVDRIWVPLLPGVMASAGAAAAWWTRRGSRWPAALLALHVVQTAVFAAWLDV